MLNRAEGRGGGSLCRQRCVALTVGAMEARGAAAGVAGARVWVGGAGTAVEAGTKGAWGWQHLQERLQHHKQTRRQRR